MATLFEDTSKGRNRKDITNLLNDYKSLSIGKGKSILKGIQLLLWRCEIYLRRMQKELNLLVKAFQLERCSSNN